MRKLITVLAVLFCSGISAGYGAEPDLKPGISVLSEERYKRWADADIKEPRLLSFDAVGWHAPTAIRIVAAQTGAGLTASVHVDRIYKFYRFCYKGKGILPC